MIHHVADRAITLNLLHVEGIVFDLPTLFIFGAGLSYSLIPNASPAEAMAVVDAYVACHAPDPRALDVTHPIFRHPTRHIALDARRVEAAIPDDHNLHIIFLSGRKTVLPRWSAGSEGFDLAQEVLRACQSVIWQ